MMKKIIFTLMTAIFVFTVCLGFAPVATTYAATEYHAYMGIQTNTKLWIYRNAFDDKTVGYGTEAFKGMSSGSGKDLITYDGTFSDVTFTKDGTYTVVLDKPDFAGETSMSQLFVSTDIPMSSKLKVTNVILKMDGSTVHTFNKGVIDMESKAHAMIMCINIWRPELEGLFSAKLPFSKCEITFTVSGLKEVEAEQEVLKDFSFQSYKDHVAIAGYTGSDTSITLPSNALSKTVTEISANAFQKSSVKEVIIPNTVVSIGKNAFYNSKITSVTIPKSVTTIGTGAFASCTSCQKFTVAKGNTNFVVKNGVLYSKDMKTLVQYPASQSAKTFTIPSSVTAIQGGAFDGCTKLIKLTISDKVKTIGKDTFKGCDNLTIYAPSGSVAYTYAIKQGVKAKKG